MTPPSPPGRPPGRGLRWLDAIERAGNRLPEPATLFVVLAMATLALSWLFAQLGVSVTHPRDGTTLAAVNLLNGAGVRRILTEATRNFVTFAPLGTVLVAMLGIGVAEASGLIAVALRGFVMSIPAGLLTAAVVFAGVNANLAADAGIILLPPVAAMLFAAAGRHPFAGIAAAYAGVSGGFSANLLPSTLDVLLAGFTQSAVDASKLMPGYHVNVLGNYYFMVAATPLLTVAGAWVTDRVIEPRLGRWQPTEPTGLQPLTAEERRGLIAAGLAMLATVALMLGLTLPAGAPLRDAGGGRWEQLKPFFDSMVTWVMLLFFIPGLAYGIATRRIASDRDVVKMTGDTMAAMGTYIVLAFVAGQFVSYFAWSNLGAILAISGADALRAIGLQGGLLLVGFVLFAAGINLFIVSASAKWALMAPVFVPMFALIGLTPEATQAVFRIGDSTTNIISPLMPYLPFVLVVARRYDPKVGIGSILATMVPYTLLFLPLWTGLLLLFYALGWPLGPGTGFHLPG